MKVLINKLSVYDIEPLNQEETYYKMELNDFDGDQINCTIFIELEIDKKTMKPIESSFKLIEAFNHKGQPCDVENFDEIKNHLCSIIKEFSEKNQL